MERIMRITGITLGMVLLMVVAAACAMEENLRLRYGSQQR